MVLEQKMTENTAGGATSSGGASGGQPDLHSAHSKKMSLATKLKKQRRIRESGSKSPVPADNNNDNSNNNNKEVVVNNKVVESSSSKSAAAAAAAATEDHHHEQDGVHTKASEESHTSATSNTTGASDDAQSKASSSGGSVGASLLHNKRRAMHLAKNKKAYQQQKSVAASTTASAKEEEDTTVQAAKQADSTSKTNSTTTTSGGAAKASSSSVSHNPLLRKMQLGRGKFAANPSMTSTDSHEEVTPTPSGDSNMLTSVNLTQSEESRENDISERLSQVSISSSKGGGGSSVAARSSSVISNGVVAYDDSIMSIARLDNFRSKANQDKANHNKKQQQYPGSSATKQGNDDDKAPPAPQEEPQQPASTGVPPQKTESTPPPSSQQQQQPSWKSRRSSGGGQKPSWMNARSPSPTVTEEPSSSSSNEVPDQQNDDNKSTVSVSSSTAKLRNKFSQSQPSWRKSPTPNNNTAPGNKQVEEAPSSPTPSTYSAMTEQQYKVSPARSTYSSVSYKPDRTGASESLMMPKFSSSRSDVSASSSTVPTAIRAKSWKPSSSSVVKSYVPQQQEDARPVSPTPSWPSAANEPKCPSSPSPSQISDIESEADKAAATTEHVPKAKTWSAKKQTPSWANKRNSTSSASPVSQQKATTPSWVKNNSAPGRSPLPQHTKPVLNRQGQATEEQQQQQRSSVSSSSPRRNSAPSWVKPSADKKEETEEPMPAPVATAKTWGGNSSKQQPEWMKRAQGGAEEEEEKVPPAPVPTTKSYAVKKQAPVWMKQAPGNNVDAECNHTENPKNTVVAPSPRRHSAPTWKKPSGGDTVPPSPQKTPAWKRQSSGGSDADKVGSPAQNNKPTSRSRSPSITEQQPKSPRRQSWGGTNRGPSPPAEKSTIGPQFKKTTKATEHSKVPASPGLAKKQRCPSPSVMQLQNEIFATKLGVLDNGSQHDKHPPKPFDHHKAPASPAPRVAQLQEKIFSPNTDKNKRQSLGSENMDSPSPAKGWWKRVPNAPDIDASPLPEVTNVYNAAPESDKAPPQKAWKKPSPLANAPGTPSFLKDVAAFHDSTSPELPAQPPLYQQAEAQPQSVQVPQPKSRDSENGTKKIDESSSELMVMSSASTTSRDDVTMQQEETKSLIQMAADSVLIADYEQAMKRAALESKSYDDEESEHGAAEETLPADLPAEFQKALTVEGDEGGVECAASPPVEEDRTAEKAIEERGASSSPKQDVFPSTSETTVPSEEQQANQGTSEVVFGEPSTYGVAGGDDVPAPKVADRAKALLGWAETRLQSPARTEKSQVEINSESKGLGNAPSLPQPRTNQNVGGVAYDENGFPCSPLVDENVPVTFEQNEFSSRQWIEELDDEKKDAEPTELWPTDPLYELNDASASEWGNRDPGLDMVPMHSPEPASAGMEKITATMFQEHRIPADPALDNSWVQVSGNSQPTVQNHNSHQAARGKSPGTQQATMEQAYHNAGYSTNGGAWVSPQQPVRREPRATVPEPQSADPMWGSEQAIDATWGSPDPFAPTSISQFDMMSPEEPKSVTKPLGDAFDPFGGEDDGFMHGASGQLFTEPNDPFVAAESFAHAPVMQGDGFDSFYHPQQQGIPLRPVSQDMDQERTEI